MERIMMTKKIEKEAKVFVRLMQRTIGGYQKKHNAIERKLEKGEYPGSIEYAQMIKDMMAYREAIDSLRFDIGNFS